VYLISQKYKHLSVDTTPYLPKKCFYTHAEDIIISVRSLQRIEGDLSDP